MTTRTEEAADWLREHGAAGIAHPGGTLFEHLDRVAVRLGAWGCPESVQLAGLAHAAYGTAGFDDALISPEQRDELREVIGPDAEALVYLYGACDRSTSYPQFPLGNSFTLADRFTGDDMRLTAEETRAFVALTFANEIDVMQHNDELAQKHGRALYDLAARSLHWLPDSARDDLALLVPVTDRPEA